MWSRITSKSIYTHSDVYFSIQRNKLEIQNTSLMACRQEGACVNQVFFLDRQSRKQGQVSDVLTLENFEYCEDSFSVDKGSQLVTKSQPISEVIIIKKVL